MSREELIGKMMEKQLIGIPGLRHEVGITPPFMMLDQAEVDGMHLRGRKLFTSGEPYFVGHFPGQPIVPGVLQLEAMCQLMRVSRFCAGGEAAAEQLFLTGTDRVKFRRPILPGDCMDVELEVSEGENGRLKVQAKTLVDGQVACQALLEFSLVGAPGADPSIAPMQPMPDPVIVVETQEILKINPHRVPMLLVDRVFRPEVLAIDVPVLATKNLSVNELVMQACPGDVPAFPNPLLNEVCAQTCCVIALSMPQYQGALTFFMSIDDAVFYRPALAGDALTIEVVPKTMKERFGMATGRIFAGVEPVMSCSMKFAFVKE